MTSKTVNKSTKAINEARTKIAGISLFSTFDASNITQKKCKLLITFNNVLC